MTIYITGSTFQQVIHNTIMEADEIIINQEVTNEADFLKYVKQSMATLASVDTLIIDISACINTDEEIITALEMIRTMYDQMKIIVFAAYRATGDEFLTKCFSLGIWNIINTDDFLEIREELLRSLKTGKTFKDAVKYKNHNPEKVIVKHEVKKTVNKKMIGITGTEQNIGVTHNAIVLANYFRKKGYLVALAEMNHSGDYKRIMEEYEEQEYGEGYFTFNGIDYYPECDEKKLVTALEHPYNFILIDFGTLMGSDLITYERCDEKIVIAGSKPWEYKNLTGIFNLYEGNRKALHKITFCFNMTPKKEHEAIRQGMGDIKDVHFLKYTEDPFSNSDFVDADSIFMEYLPEKEESEKKKFGLWGKGKKHEKTKKQKAEKQKNPVRRIPGNKEPSGI